MNDMFDNVWAGKDTIVVDQAVDVTLPVCTSATPSIPRSSLSTCLLRLLFLLLALQALGDASRGRTTSLFSRVTRWHSRRVSNYYIAPAVVITNITGLVTPCLHGHRPEDPMPRLVFAVCAHQTSQYLQACIWRARGIPTPIIVYQSRGWYQAFEEIHAGYGRISS